MIRFDGSRLLLDIEGTTSSVSYVFDVMFPFAHSRIQDYLEQHWEDDGLQATLAQVARDAGQRSVEDLCETDDPSAQRRFLVDHLQRLMEADAKETGLKQLQGMIWREGFESGELRAHLFDDVEPALRKWRAVGRDIRIYSSGSAEAQKLFFGHTIHGDLLDRFSGHYDTRIGSKREAASYARIVDDWGGDAKDILFLSDVVAELDAAASVGLHTGLVCRPGNAAAPAHQAHPVIRSFEEVSIHA